MIMHQHNLHRLPGLLFAALLVLLTLGSCAITRTETDYYTITIRDTTYRESVRNVPGVSSGTDNGVVFPSSRTINISRQTISYDSTYDRKYPAFLRVGGIEFAGLIGTSSTGGLGPGFLGLYSLFDSTSLTNRGTFFNPSRGGEDNSENNLFKGMLLRVAPYEYQLHWFNESPNWTIGSSAFELLAKNEHRDNWLYSVGANGYIRKRFFLRDRIPYVIATPFVGVSLAPSLYANVGGELQLGSYGGYNLRAYAGLASGFTWGTFLSKNEASKGITFPYFGLGVSALDFTNRVEETEREWKEYVHSAIEVDMLDVGLLSAFKGYPNIFDTAVSRMPITGGYIRLADSHFPLPFADNHFWIGTSLINFFSLGFGQSAFSVLPLRLGYRQYLIAEDLTIEPQLEYNYYPSAYYDIGARLRLNTFSGYTIGLKIGYADGTSGAFLPRILFAKTTDAPGSFASGYIGLTFGISDHLLRPEVVEQLRASEH